MKLLVINMFGVPKAKYKEIEAFPTKEQLNSMAKAGYKFKIDGKFVTKKKIEELKNNKGDM